MEYRTLNLTLVSAQGLKKPSFMGKMDVYAVASISGQKFKTCVDKNGGSDPTWNFPMPFVIDEAAGLQNRLTLVVKIKAAWMFGGWNLGEVHVPVKELLKGVKGEGIKAMQSVSYQVKPKGVLSFKYEIGEKIIGKMDEPVTAYPAPAGGYGYPYQQPGYGYYPPPPAATPVVQPRRSGMGFGTGLLGGALGGMLIGDMMSGGGCGGGCGGGGCGGGGCGGGCGG
ncbi:hypothetical protein L1987_81006 [Smallanthus sonchifolius]|uniref:Uncharacterized protein n=1 Tax=Smallanthus sonchifolius TaxID=185202 RepID=A0ACB8YQD1_9ASTR|nr:hypothetical protein L1987_81006 [Smallanthus sonchifolius]